MAALEASLRRLGTDRIDLYQQHFADQNMPVDEVLEALDRLVRDGKIREVGCCNLAAETVVQAAHAAEVTGLHPFRSCQLQFSVLERPDVELLAALERHSVALLAYWPLANGLLTGKYRRDAPPPPGSRLGAQTMVSQFLRDGIMASRPPLSPERLATVERLDTFAREHRHTLLELAISWLISQPNIRSVLTGVTDPHQAEANAGAAGWLLSDTQKAEIDVIVENESAPT